MQKLKQRNMRITGPTPLPPPVLEALSRQMVSHRSQDFRTCLQRVVHRLKPLFGTKESPMLFTASGTGGMEAMIVNTIEPGQKVLAIRIGMFGDRFAEIARMYGADVIDWKISQGQPATPEELKLELRKAGKIDAVLITHNETTTGVLNPLRDLTAVIREETDALILVDGISSVRATPVLMEEWGVDAVVTASQKALMSPPGLAIIAANQRVQARAARCRAPKYYFDFNRMKDAIAEGTTTYTPAVSSIYGLDAALQMIETEGFENCFERHRKLSEQLRTRLRQIGITCFAKPGFESPSVTAILLPEGHSATTVRSRLEKEHGVFVAQGRKELKERMLRIGHMGWFDEESILGVSEALAACL